jgi:two-component system response regulator HydG
VLDVSDIPPEIRPVAAPASGASIQPGIRLDDAERLLIERTLEMTAGNRQEAAKTLGIGERTLYRKIKQYGLA